jgi:hypothetical protein
MIKNAYVNDQQPRTITHREGFEGYTITEEHYRDMQGNMRCSCTIDDPHGKFVRRYANIEDATQYLRAHLNMQRIKAESKTA